MKLGALKRQIEDLKQLPAGERKARREGFCGLYGQKVDPIEKKVKQLKDLYQKIREAQQAVLDNPKVQSSLTFLHRQMVCSMFEFSVFRPFVHRFMETCSDGILI